jgi:exopolysaccharide biosynthesis polyprenyl glycosylphosphotransferase
LRRLPGHTDEAEGLGTAMIRRHASALRFLFALVDAAGALVALAVVGAIRFSDGSVFESLQVAIPSWELAVGGFITLWPVSLWLHGLYRVRARLTIRRELLDIGRSVILFAAVILSLLFLLKLPDVSRGLLIPLFPTMGAISFGARLALRGLLARLRIRGRNTRFVLIVGTNARAQQFANMLESHTDLGLRVIGHLGADGDERARLTRPVLGDLEALEDILHSNVVDEVALCLPVAQWQRIDELARLCEEEGKIVRVPLYVLEHTLSKGRVEEVDGLPIYSMVTGPDRILALTAKRAVDVIGSAIACVVLSPVLLAIAVAIRLDSRGPILFRQERVGEHGRRFRIVKFRTMVVDAEEHLEELRDRNEIQGHAFKVTSDPRITKVGRWLRATSLDELPQVWNVLRGEMSLVGPRPPLASEVAGYDIWHRRRLSMKPGITGLWQVDGRRESDFDRWVETDLAYIDGWSFWLDLRIIARTIPAMLHRQGR